jgi:hypothetical protein
MKKHICTIIAFAVFAASALAYDGQDLRVSVNIPFAFQAGVSTLPAGAYTVTAPVSGFYLIQGSKGGAFVPRSAVLVDIDDSGKTSFRFAVTGDKYILQAVHPIK